MKRLLFLFSFIFILFGCKKNKIYEKNKDNIYFGYYPMTLEVNNKKIEQLNKRINNTPTIDNYNDWISFNYYDNNEISNYISDKKDFLYHFIPTTHSKLTPGNISIFFNEIKQQIESCGYKFSTKINVEAVKNTSPQKFIGRINMLTDLKWKGNTSYKTNLCNNKDDAIKMCHFWVLISLINQKYLDDHFKFCKKEKPKKNQ